MACQNHPGPWPDAKWEPVEQFACLGHILSPNASVIPCWQNTRHAMWKSYFANCSHKALGSLPLSTKLKMIQKSCKQPFSYRCSRWPPARELSRAIDRVQAKMTAGVMRTPLLPSEDPVSYIKRRNKEAAQMIRLQGRWSLEWHVRCWDWQKHCDRGHDDKAWHTKLMKCQNFEWLTAQRHAVNGSGTGTRAHRGAPCVRWDEGLKWSLSYIP
mmetsp:Transcript_89998/g.263073  ORF Transcript_89998/g.263073 Transcript_89998/m.263073 type:complete len:213 (-) Transcript_89998:121-759(-)